MVQIDFPIFAIPYNDIIINFNTNNNNSYYCEVSGYNWTREQKLQLLFCKCILDHTQLWINNNFCIHHGFIVKE